MLKTQNKLSNDDIGILFFLAALIFGGWFRIYPALMTGFPINDGGLFYKMIEAVQLSNFQLPVYVEYNGLQIPFAYPPLAFYLAGAIGKWLHISTLSIVLWMPAIVLILTLPCVFLLTRHLLNSTLKAGVTTFLYALLPRTLTWLIMGGGITRGLGQLFLILAMLSIYLLFTKKQTKYIYIAIIFSAAVCLTHPEASIHAIAIGLALLVFYGRDRDGVRNALIVGAGTLLVTAPWWSTVLHRFGIEPFLAASQTGFHTPYSGFSIFFVISEEPFNTIIATLAVIGLFTQIAKRQFFLPALFIMPSLVEPRSAPNIAVLPVTMLAAICLIDVVLPGIAKLEANLHEVKTNSILQSLSEKLLLAYITIALLFGIISFDTTLSQRYLPNESRTAFQWVKTNTPQNTEFLVITGDLSLFSDYANEWFPVFAARRSHTTIQGYEWIIEKNFQNQAGLVIGYQYCLQNEAPRACIEALANKSNTKFDYVLIQRDGEFTDSLTLDLTLNKDYQSIYASRNIVIFERKH